MTDEEKYCGAVRNHGDPRCRLEGISFLEDFLVADAPPDLDEVEAAIDAEPPVWWVRWVRIGVILFTLGFWALVIRAVFF